MLGGLCHTANSADPFPESCYSHVRQLRRRNPNLTDAQAQAQLIALAWSERPAGMRCERPCKAGEVELSGMAEERWLYLNSRPPTEPLLGATFSRPAHLRTPFMRRLLSRISNMSDKGQPSGLLMGTVTTGSERAADRLLRSMVSLRSQGWLVDWVALRLRPDTSRMHAAAAARARRCGAMGGRAHGSARLWCAA